MTPGSRNVVLTWAAFPGADTYRIERKLTTDTEYTLVEAAAVSPYTDWIVSNGLYDYRMTALGGSTQLAVGVKQVTVADLEEMPGPIGLWFDIVNVSGFSLDWDQSNDPNWWTLNEWRQRSWTVGDPPLPRWVADSSHGPELSFVNGNEAYYGQGFPVLFFGNSSVTSLNTPTSYMTLADAPGSLEPPCSILMNVTRTYGNNDDPRCLLQLGKLSLYSSTGAGRQLGLRVQGGGFLTSSLAINNSLNYLVAVIARSETDIDFHRILPGTNTWASDLGRSGAAWENHGEFTIGGSLVSPYHSNRFLTSGFATWNKALTLLELQRAINVVVNNNNLHGG